MQFLELNYTTFENVYNVSISASLYRMLLIQYRDQERVTTVVVGVVQFTP